MNVSNSRKKSNQKSEIPQFSPIKKGLSWGISEKVAYYRPFVTKIFKRKKVKKTFELRGKWNTLAHATFYFIIHQLFL